MIGSFRLKKFSKRIVLVPLWTSKSLLEFEKNGDIEGETPYWFMVKNGWELIFNFKNVYFEKDFDNCEGKPEFEAQFYVKFKLDTDPDFIAIETAAIINDTHYNLTTDERRELVSEVVKIYNET